MSRRHCFVPEIQMESDVINTLIKLSIFNNFHMVMRNITSTTCFYLALLLSHPDLAIWNYIQKQLKFIKPLLLNNVSYHQITYHHLLINSTLQHMHDLGRGVLNPLHAFQSCRNHVKHFNLPCLILSKFYQNVERNVVQFE